MNRFIITTLDYRDRARSAMRRLIRDERGDSLQWVMGLAIAATIIISLLIFGQDGLDYLKTFWEDAKKK